MDVITCMTVTAMLNKLTRLFQTLPSSYRVELNNMFFQIDI